MRKPVFGVCEQQRRRQPVHPRSLISAYVIRLLVSFISRLAMSGIFDLVSVAEETGLSLALSVTRKTGFVATRPIYKPCKKKFLGLPIYEGFDETAQVCRLI